MRIADPESKRSIDEITLFLDQEEINQLICSLQQLQARSIQNHVHISSQDYKREITIAHFDPTNVSLYDEFSKKVILED